IFVIILGLVKINNVVIQPIVEAQEIGDEAETSYNDLDAKLEDIDELLGEKYYESIDQAALNEAAYEGYVSGLGDPYTTYFSKEDYTSFMEDTNGSYEGIGVVVTFGENGEDIEVLSPFAGSPGEKAGVLQGDRILKVDGADVSGMALEEVVKLIKGPKGTDVIVTVYRKLTDKIIDLTITRDVINMQTVTHEMLPGDIGYMTISGFEGVTYDQFIEAYDDLEKQGQKGMILDLRNNPGGYVHIVAKIADELLGKGLIVYTEDKNGKKEEIYSDADHQFQKPLVILVNAYSASASEILAGAVKDYKVGTIVGTTTFGKGVVQGTYELEDGSAVKVTVAKYYTPAGNNIHGIGIEPDIAIELPEELQNQFRVEKDQDTQFQKAVEVMQGLLVQ
ncbi:MAG: S41 family peptidase, partial [Vallitaleaceae bacterium]|nr:S41 family peptidase [Vallitaleaceae bacterium]